MAKPKKENSRPIVTWKDGVMVVDKQHPTFRKLVQHRAFPEDYIERCLSDEDGLEWFSKWFLSESFNKPFTDQRREFARDFSNPDIAKVWGVASRGFGKSALVMAGLIRGIVLRLYEFIVYSSAELGLAETRTENIKSMLLTNHRLRLFFGDMSPQYVDGRRAAFGTSSYTLSDPITNEAVCCVVPKSEGTTVNGLLEMLNGRFIRPSVLISDDGEDRKRVDSEEYRKAHTDWFFDTFLPCVDTDYEPDNNRWGGLKRSDKAPWLVRVIDTCKHEGALVETLAQDADWHGARFPQAREESPGVFVSLNPNVTDEQITAKFKAAIARGGEGGFYREFMCLPRETSDATFPSSFQYYNDAGMGLNQDRNVFRFIIVDPARTTNTKAAHSAMLAVAVDPHKAIIYFRKLIDERMTPEELEATLFALSEATNAQLLCVEDAGLNDWIKGPLQQGAEKRGLYPQWLWLKPGSGNIATSGDFGVGRDAIKRRRAASIIAYYRPFEPSHPHGHILHDESLKGCVLEQQMHSYPRPKRWDALDTAGYVDLVMREIGIRFDIQSNPEQMIELTLGREAMDERHRSGSWRACAV